jgi:hypothetical protein
VGAQARKLAWQLLQGIQAAVGAQSRSWPGSYSRGFTPPRAPIAELAWQVLQGIQSPPWALARELKHHRNSEAVAGTRIDSWESAAMAHFSTPENARLEA